EALLALGKIGDPAALGILRNALDGWPDRIEPITALGHLRDSTPVQRLLELLDDPEHPFKEEIVRVIGVIGDPMAAKKLMELLHDQDRMVRYEAAWALYRIGGRDVAQSLCRLLSDPDEWIVINILEILSRLKEADAIPALVGQFEIARDPRLKAIMISSLAMFAEPQLLHIFEKGLESFDPRIQANSVEAIAMLRIPAPEMRRKLKKFFSHPNNRVRANVCIALAKADETKVVEEIDAMLASPDVPTRRSAGYVLSRVQIRGRDGLIDRLLADEAYVVRKMALKAALALETEVGQARIVPLLRDPNQWVRREAVDCARKIPGFPAEPVLEAFKAESSPPVWESMLAFFTERHLDGCIPLIVQKIKAEPEEGLPRLISALGHLDARDAIAEAKRFVGTQNAENMREFFIALLLHGDLTVLTDLANLLRDKTREEEQAILLRVAGDVGEFVRNPDGYSRRLREVLAAEVKKDMEGVAALDAAPTAAPPLPADLASLPRGLALLEAGKLDEAQRFFESFVGIFPHHPEGLFSLASVYFKKNLAERALPYLVTLMDKAPSHVAGGLLLGQIHFQKKNWTALLELYDRLRKHVPADDRRTLGQVNGALGLAYFHLKKYQKAIEVLNQAIRENARDLSSAYHLALSYYAVREHGAALKLLRGLKKSLPPDSRVFRNVEELLQKLEDEN
ncbi:MAG TPA: HEAT repeat domain-containing protein, partial [Candidatus Ozemobacteraceae bacterium]